MRRRRSGWRNYYYYGRVSASDVGEWQKAACLLLFRFIVEIAITTNLPRLLLIVLLGEVEGNLTIGMIEVAVIKGFCGRWCNGS